MSSDYFVFLGIAIIMIIVSFLIGRQVGIEEGVLASFKSRQKNKMESPQ